MKTTYNKLLKAYWLRPEGALVRACDIEAMKRFNFIEPSLDLGCGDGVFSFFRAGGEFEDEFDVYDVGKLDQYFDNVDVYDFYTEPSKKLIKKEAEYKISVGLDIKESLLKKAANKNLYRELVTADISKKLPFADGTFMSIFTNVLSMLDNAEAALAEIFRVLKVGGEACVMLPDINWINNELYYSQYIKKGKPLNLEFLKYIDQGRLDTVRSIKTLEEWREIITSIGFNIKECTPFYSNTLMKIWDIGFRPIFPLLKKMTDSIDENKRMEIKKEWVEFFQVLGESILENEKMCLKEGASFYCFILTK